MSADDATRVTKRARGNGVGGGGGGSAAADVAAVWAAYRGTAGGGGRAEGLAAAAADAARCSAARCLAARLLPGALAAAPEAQRERIAADAVPAVAGASATAAAADGAALADTLLAVAAHGGTAGGRRAADLLLEDGNVGSVDRLRGLIAPASGAEAALSDAARGALERLVEVALDGAHRAQATALAALGGDHPVKSSDTAASVATARTDASRAHRSALAAAEAQFEVVARLEAQLSAAFSAAGISRQPFAAAAAAARRSVAGATSRGDDCKAGDECAALRAAAAMPQGHLAALVRRARGEGAELPDEVTAMLRATPGFGAADLDGPAAPTPATQSAPTPTSADATPVLATGATPTSAVHAGASVMGGARPPPSSAGVPPAPAPAATASGAAPPAVIVSVGNLPVGVVDVHHERALRRALADHGAPQPASLRVIAPFHPGDPPEAQLEFGSAALASHAVRLLDRFEIAPRHWLTAMVLPTREGTLTNRYAPAAPAAPPAPGPGAPTTGLAPAPPAAAAAVGAAQAAPAAAAPTATAGLDATAADVKMADVEPTYVDLHKSGALVAHCEVVLDESRRAVGFDEPRAWPSSLDVVKRADLNHVLGTVARAGAGVGQQALCRIAPAPDAAANGAAGHDVEHERRAFAKFVDYFARKGRAGLVETTDGRRIYLIPPGTSVCSRLMCAVEPRLCLLGLIAPSAPIKK